MIKNTYLMQWTMLKEKPPDVARVLVSYTFGVMEAYYYNDIFRKDLISTEEIPGVYAWMRLPPKAEVDA